MNKVSRILIVDDDEKYVNGLKRILNNYILRQNGEYFDIFTAKNGIEGISKAKAISPDIIFMDYLMPELDGVSAMKQLKNNHITKDIFIVLMSGEKYVDTRGCTFLSKPIRSYEIYEIVGKYLNKDVSYLR
jgi:two-component system alkaline phosphatase synthesis response regulator PhoP